METLYEYKESVRSEVREMTGELLDDPYADDRIFEIVDSSVPVYNSTLLELAASNYDLALVEPELGPAFDGSATPVNIIAANVFEALRVVADEEFREIQEEWEDIEFDWDEAEAEFEVAMDAREIVNEACEAWYEERTA